MSMSSLIDPALLDSIVKSVSPRKQKPINSTTSEVSEAEIERGFETINQDQYHQCPSCGGPTYRSGVHCIHCWGGGYE